MYQSWLHGPQVTCSTFLYRPHVPWGGLVDHLFYEVSAWNSSMMQEVSKDQISCNCFYKIQKCLDAEKLFILKQQKVTVNLQRLFHKSILPLTSLAPWSQLTTLDVFYWIRAMIWTVDHEYFKLTGTRQWYLTLVRDHLCMCSANEKWYYIVKSSLIGTAHTQNDPRWV